MTLLIVNPWQSFVCFIGSVVTRCICFGLHPLLPDASDVCASAGYMQCSGLTSVYLCATSQYHRTLVPLSVSLWNDLADPIFDGLGLAGFKSRANAFLLAYAAVSLL